MNFGIASSGCCCSGCCAHVQAHSPAAPAAHRGGAGLRLPVRRGAHSIGKFAQWDNDKDFYQQQYVDARALADILPEGAYRIDDYECYDNVGLWVNRSDLQTFNSTVAPSILESTPRWA